MNLPADNRFASAAPPALPGHSLRLTAPVETIGNAILQVVTVWRGRIMSYQLLSQRRSITIGPGHTWWLRVPAWLPYHKYLRMLVPDPAIITPRLEGRARHRLLKPRRGGYLLRLSPALAGEVRINGEDRHASDITGDVLLGPGDRAKLHFTEAPELTMEIRWVDRPEVLARPKVEDAAMFQTLIGTSIVLGLAAALLWFMYRAPDKTLAMTAERVAKIETPVLEIVKKATARRAEEKKEKEAEKKKKEEGQMKKAKDKAGKVGRADASQKDTVIPRGEKDVLRQKVSKVGLLGLIGKERPQGSGLSKLFAEDTAVEQAVAGMAGVKMVAGRGNGGLATSGAGPGGGGTSYGHISGAGNLDTGGRGAHGKGRGGPKLAERGEREVSVGLGGGGGDMDGSLTKEQVYKVVRAHFAGVTYCYEKELQHKSGLSGAVDLFWVIQPDGTVGKANVKHSTLGDTAVEGCILRQVKQWQFPKAAGQTIVGQMPFLFKGGH